MMNKKQICKEIRKSLDVAEVLYDSKDIRKIIGYLEQSYNFDKMSKSDIDLMMVSVIISIEVLPCS